MDALDQQPTSDQLQQQLQTLTQENLNLREKNEQLVARGEYLERRLGQQAGSTTDLSCRLVHSEEDRLKISKELVEEKMHANKMREQYEEEAFQLRNKVFDRDAAITRLEGERDELLLELRAARACLKEKERRDSERAEEHATLQRDYLVLSQAGGRVQNQEMSAQLLALARAQDELRSRLDRQQDSLRGLQGLRDQLDQLDRVQSSSEGLQDQLDRVRALISCMAHDRVQPEDLAALDEKQKTMERSLRGNQEQLRDQLERMRSCYEEQQAKLEEKVVVMGKEQQESAMLIRLGQQRLAQQTAALRCSQSQAKEAEEENSRLQLQVKQLNEEYRARLLCYLQDLSKYIDGLGNSKIASKQRKLKTFVDAMLQDVRRSYRLREEQLASAARRYRKRLQKITRTHQELLLAYRAQREQIVARPDGGLSPGPPETQFSLELSDVREEAETELRGLGQDKARPEAQSQGLGQDKARPEPQPQAAGEQAAADAPAQNRSCHGPEALQQSGEASWSDRRDRLRQATASTLFQQVEGERALLLTRATVAESEVLELQHYIDNHLLRYKEEIAHLRRLHETARRSHSAPSSPQ